MLIRHIVFATVLASACPIIATAQTVRQAGVTPTQPGVRAPDIDPTQGSLAALTLKLDALTQMVGRQIIVLEQVDQTATLWPAASDNFSNNNTRSTHLCKLALGDRFGRVLSRQRQVVGDQYFLSRVVCETQP